MDASFSKLKRLLEAEVSISGLRKVINELKRRQSSFERIYIVKERAKDGNPLVAYFNAHGIVFGYRYTDRKNITRVTYLAGCLFGKEAPHFSYPFEREKYELVIQKWMIKNKNLISVIQKKLAIERLEMLLSKWENKQSSYKEEERKIKKSILQELKVV